MNILHPITVHYTILMTIYLFYINSNSGIHEKQGHQQIYNFVNLQVPNP